MERDGRTVWAVGAGDDCEHPVEAVQYLGSDGTSVYAQCSQCESTIIAPIG